MEFKLPLWLPDPFFPPLLGKAYSICRTLGEDLGMTEGVRWGPIRGEAEFHFKSFFYYLKHQYFFKYQLHSNLKIHLKRHHLPKEETPFLLPVFTHKRGSQSLWPEKEWKFHQNNFISCHLATANSQFYILFFFLWSQSWHSSLLTIPKFLPHFKIGGKKIEGKMSLLF